MTILTIDEAAQFLRVTKRTLYRHPDIPRIRIGHQLRFVREELEEWIASQQVRECFVKDPVLIVEQRVDECRQAPYHRNPIFRLPASRRA